MSWLPSALEGLAGAAGKLGGQAADILRDRLELLALELREERVRFLQALILALAGTVLVLAGLGLLVAALILALPAEWRLPGLLLAGAGTAGLGAYVLSVLRNRLSARTGAFAQSLAELEKDKACF